MNDFLPTVVLNYLPYGIGLILLIIGLFVVRMLVRASVRHKVASIKDGPAMSMMDIDTLRKRGLVTDTECKAIRHALAEREVDRERRRIQAERERVLLAQIEQDPDVARQLLTSPSSGPEPRPQQRLEKIAPARPTAVAGTVPARPAPAPKIVATPQAAPARPAGRVDGKPPSAAPASRASDLDVLLEKGAITLEEYDRLRAFFQ